MGAYYGSLRGDGSNYGSPRGREGLFGSLREGGYYGSPSQTDQILREAGKYSTKPEAGSPPFLLRPEPPSARSRLAALGSNLHGRLFPYRQATAQDMANFQ